MLSNGKDRLKRWQKWEVATTKKKKTPHLWNQIWYESDEEGMRRI